MENRFTFEEYGCLLALMAKSRCEDPFTKIGGIALNKDGRILGASYNGLKPGAIMPNWMCLEDNRKKKSDFFIHCESNLCAFLTKGECHTMCLTQSPCIKCCQNIAALDIQKVIYIKEYEKCKEFKEFFDFHKIECKELTNESKEKILNYIKDILNFSELF